MNSEHCRKLFKDGLTLTCSAFRFLHGDKSSVQGFQVYVLKFFPISKRIFEGFELVEIWQTLHHLGAKKVGLFTCVHFASLDLFQLIIVAKELRIFLEPFLVGLSWSG